MLNISVKFICSKHEKFIISENTKGTISDSYLEDLVSETLRKLDIDDDGYITYAEYRRNY